MSIWNYDKPLFGHRILLIDDSKAITSLLAETCFLAGATPVEVNGGQEAIERLERERFDAIVMDLVMPQPDGWAILQHMKTRADLLRRTVVLTAYNRDPQVNQALHQWNVAHLFKPFALDELIAKIAQLIDAFHTTAA